MGTGFVTWMLQLQIYRHGLGVHLEAPLKEDRPSLLYTHEKLALVCKPKRCYPPWPFFVCQFKVKVSNELGQELMQFDLRALREKISLGGGMVKVRQRADLQVQYFDRYTFSVRFLQMSWCCGRSIWSALRSRATDQDGSRPRPCPRCLGHGSVPRD